MGEDVLTSLLKGALCSFFTAVCPLQALSGGLFMHQSRTQSRLQLHQLRLLQLGLPLPVPTHDPGLLGEPLPAGVNFALSPSLTFKQ